jgi:hypothetical protein
MVLFLTIQLCKIEFKLWLERQKGWKKCSHTLISIESCRGSMPQSRIEYFVIVIMDHIISDCAISYGRTDDKVDKLNEITFCEVTRNDWAHKSCMIKWLRKDMIVRANVCDRTPGWRRESVTIWQNDRQILSDDWKIFSGGKTQIYDRLHFVNIKKFIFFIDTLNSWYCRGFTDLYAFPGLLIVSGDLSHSVALHSFPDLSIWTTMFRNYNYTGRKGLRAFRKGAEVDFTAPWHSSPALSSTRCHSKIDRRERVNVASLIPPFFRNIQWTFNLPHPFP